MDKDDAVIFGGLVVGILTMVGYVIVAAFATEYVVEFWGTFLMERPVDVSLGIAGLVGLVAGGVTIPVALMTLLIAPVLL